MCQEDCLGSETRGRASLRTSVSTDVCREDYLPKPDSIAGLAQFCLRTVVRAFVYARLSVRRRDTSKSQNTLASNSPCWKFSQPPVNRIVNSSGHRLSCDWYGYGLIKPELD